MYFSNSLFMESSYCFKIIAGFSHMIKTGRSWKAFTAFNQKKGNVKVKKKYCFRSLINLKQIRGACLGGLVYNFKSFE